MSWPRFVWLRIARLYPLHILTAGVMAVLYWRAQVYSEFDGTLIFETVTLTQSLISGRWSLNWPAWSIGAEFWCGMLLLALWSRSPRVRIAAALLGVGTLIAIEIFFGFLATTTPRYGVALGCFAVGWFVHELPARKWPVLGWCLVLVAFVAMMVPPLSGQGRPWIEILYVPVFALIILALAYVELPRALQPVARLSGDISYGIYLWHWAFLLILPPTSAARTALFFAVVIVWSWISFTWFERPAMALLRSWTPRSVLKEWLFRLRARAPL